MEHERDYITKLDGDDYDWALADLQHLNRLPARLKAEDRALSEALRARDSVEEQFRNSRKADLSAEFVHKVAEFDQYVNQSIRENMVIFRRLASIVDRNYDGEGLFDPEDLLGGVQKHLFEKVFMRIPATYVDAGLLEFACHGINKMAEAASIDQKPADLAMRRQDWKAINALLEKIQPILDSLEGIEEVLERQQIARTQYMIETGKYRPAPEPRPGTGALPVVQVTEPEPTPEPTPEPVQAQTQVEPPPAPAPEVRPSDSQMLPKPRKPVAPIKPMIPVARPAPEPEPEPVRAEKPRKEPVADEASYRYRLNRDHLIANALGEAIVKKSSQPLPEPTKQPASQEAKPANLKIVPRKLTGRQAVLDDVKLVNDLVSLFKNQSDK